MFVATVIIWITAFGAAQADSFDCQRFRENIAVDERFVRAQNDLGTSFDFEDRNQSYQDYIEYLFFGESQPVLCTTDDRIVKWCNAVWQTSNGEVTYEKACAKLHASKEDLRCLDTLSYIMFRGREEFSKKWFDKFSGDMFSLFVSGMCGEMTSKSKASVKMLLTLSKDVDGWYAEAIASKAYELLHDKPQVILAHVKEFAQMRHLIEFEVCNISNEKREALIAEYRALSKNKNAKTVLEWLSCKEHDAAEAAAGNPIPNRTGAPKTK
jgi:hypothetical protein